MNGSTPVANSQLTRRARDLAPHRVRKDVVLAVIEQLPDRSYINEIFDQRDIHHTRSGVRVPVIEYTLAGNDTVYRLLTTIFDPTAAPATELAALYAQR
jgi:hypothetical protein